MRAEAQFLSEWFDIVAGAMKDGREVALTDIHDDFAATGEPLDGKEYSPADRRQRDGVIRSLEMALPWFERWGLITAREDRDRYTANIGLHVPARVGRLSRRGLWLTRRITYMPQ